MVGQNYYDNYMEISMRNCRNIPQLNKGPQLQNTGQCFKDFLHRPGSEKMKPASFFMSLASTQSSTQIVH